MAGGGNSGVLGKACGFASGSEDQGSARGAPASGSLSQSSAIKSDPAAEGFYDDHPGVRYAFPEDISSTLPPRSWREESSQPPELRHRTTLNASGRGFPETSCRPKSIHAWRQVEQCSPADQSCRHGTGCWMG